MGRMLISQEQPRDERSAAVDVQERTRGLTDVYERNAYLVYNLALRIAGTTGPALAAAEEAFAGQVDAGEDELVPAVVTAALGHARSRELPGDGEPDELLAANAALAPPERAALALDGLAGAGPEDIGAALRVDAAKAAALLDQAWSRLGDELGVAPDAAPGRYADWLWADPPTELWENVYRRFHAAIRRRVEGTTAAVVPVAAATTEASATAVAAAPRARRLPRLRRPRQMRVWVGLLAPLVLVIAAFGYMRASDSGDEAPRVPAGPALADGATPSYDPLVASPDTGDAAGAPSEDRLDVAARRKKPLTPKELDQLRLQELRDLRRYEIQQTDKRLTRAQRDLAAAKVALLRDLARRRAAAERRERRLARQERLQARRERRSGTRDDTPRKVTIEQRGSSGSTPTRSEQAQPAPQQPQRTAPSTSPPPANEREAETRCLQDSESGVYICEQ